MDLELLAAFPEFLTCAAESIPQSSWTVRSSDGNFAMVEQVWHLADLEVEGFGLRIRKLIDGNSPDLPDFDGASVAAQRNYRSLDLKEGLGKFIAARRASVASLMEVRDDQWSRSGQQEGVGRVTLADVPLMMARHDASHREEIEALLSELRKDK